MVKEDFKVTPWAVSGKVDYGKLIKDFGVSELNKSLLEQIKKHTGELHVFLRRGVFFSHRDLDWLLNKYEKGEKFFIYTGRGPSGAVHIGHLIPWIFAKWLQDKFGCEMYFQFTDDEKFLFRDKPMDELQRIMHENMLDVIAVGFDPKKTHFIIDTKHIGLLYPEAIKFAKKITFSTVKASFGMTNESNIGQIFFTSIQAVPAILPSVLKGKNIPCLIPLGVDQDTHFRVARDIYPKLGYYKPALIHNIFLPPLTGMEGKMSSSDDSQAILTTDSSELVSRKIKKYAFSGGRDTIEEHRKHGGNPDVDISFQYLKMFFEQDDKKLKEIHDSYKSGKLLTSELKEILIEKINKFLKEHQKRRESAKRDIEKFILKVN